MSLTFNWEKCNPLIIAGNPLYGWEENDKNNGDVAPVTKTLIFATLSVGLGKISNKNIDEFYARLIIVNKLDGIGAILTPDGERMVTEQEVIDHIGLFTNVSDETRPAWARRLFVNDQTSVTNDLVYQFQRKREAIEDEMRKKVMESIEP